MSNMAERRLKALQRAREQRMFDERYNRRMPNKTTFIRRRIIVGLLAGVGIVGLSRLDVPEDQEEIALECCHSEDQQPEIRTVPMLTPEQQADREAALRAEAAAETSTTTAPTTTVPATTTLPPLVLPEGTPCVEWAPLARQVGWADENIPQLLRIIWRESRCQPGAWNGHDAGLTQINQIHTEWLNQMGLNHPDSMFDPELNLRFALDLFQSRERAGKCGWKPWSMPCDS